MKTLYDQIGEGYDTTRRADPVILAGLAGLLDIQQDKHYLDVACGTGNYTAAMSERGGRWSAFDQSQNMLQEARAKSDAVRWSRFDVDQLGYESHSFDGAMCTLAIHHFPDLAAAFTEVARVLKPGSNFVIFTATPQQMETYWLGHYFPVMMQKSCAQMPTMEVIERAFAASGLSLELSTLFDITDDLQDLFLYSGKQRPQMYLSNKVRAGISSFRNFCTPSELEHGLSQLQADIESGVIAESMANDQSIGGDYLFLRAVNNQV